MRSVLSCALVIAAVPFAADAQTQTHGSVYETIDRLIGIEAAIESRRDIQRRRVAPEAALALEGVERPADVEDAVATEAAEEEETGLSSFFVTIIRPPAGHQPLSLTQNRALALAIGSNGLSNQPNEHIPAGYTFLGQFLDHDVTRNEMVTAEIVSDFISQNLTASQDELRSQAREILINARSSLLDLDSVYGLTIEQIENLVDTLQTSELCPLAVGERTPDCFDVTTLSDTSQRALATYELSPEGQLTGRFEIAHRATGPDGPIVPDLPRCSDVRRFIVSPACQVAEAQAEGVPDVLHRAIIGDGRNDENVIIAQIHLTFLLAHNKLFDQALADLGVNDDTATTLQRLEAFRQARQTLIDHWQAIVMDDYLTVHTDASFIDQLKTGAFKFYTARPSGAPFCEEPGRAGAMPHEFSVGAFRHGHSQVRPGYALNATSGASFADLFGDSRITADRAIDFRLFFDNVEKFNDMAPDGLEAADSMLIDPVLSPPLAQLLAPSIPKLHVGGQRLGDLAHRNLDRVGGRFIEQPDGAVGIEPIAVAFGKTVAEAVKNRGGAIELLSQEQLDGLQFTNASIVQATFGNGLTVEQLPLWVYVLSEARAQEAGNRLGDLGAHIIGETLVGLIRCDGSGVLAGSTAFEPTMIPSGGLVTEGRYSMADLINFTFE